MKMASPFEIPSSLQHLELDPYNLDPYPEDFDDHDESSRKRSFENLIAQLNDGNRYLRGGVWQEEEDDQDLWMDHARLQTLYTLVRKSMSLSASLRESFIEALCETIHLLCGILEQSQDTQTQNFRDAFGCHLYMLNSVMFLTDSHAADTQNQKPNEILLHQRTICSEIMLQAAVSMSKYRTILWQRGVTDESVVLLPCRSAYYLMERSTGVMARKALCGEVAMKIIAESVEPADAPMTPIVASLMDLMHSHEHMASMTAEICGSLCESEKLAAELLREYGRLEGAGDAKATGIKNVAPFVAELAAIKPKWVLQQLPHLLPHFQSEAYNFRSALVNALTRILEYMHESQTIMEDSRSNDMNGEGNADELSNKRAEDFSKTRNQILDLLSERVCDISSFTRSTALKAWVSLTTSRVLPKERILSLTKIAMDRLNDKTVLVRKQAMQLLTALLENNPYMGHLDPQPYKSKMAELYGEIIADLPESIKEVQDQALSELDGDEDNEEMLQDIKQATLAAAMNEVDEWNEQELTTEQQQYKNKINALKFAQNVIDFIDLFEGSIDDLEGMILSANTSDVTEALRFFVQARHFQLPCAVTGIKRSLMLMWSSEASIREEVLKAFVDIFIATPGSEGKDPLSDSQIAKNLLDLVMNASLSEIASIEEAMMCLVKEERLPEGVFTILWSACSRNRDGDVRSAALQLISMGAGSNRSIVDSKSRLKILLDHGLGDFTEDRNDWKLAAAASTALQRIGQVKADSANAKYLVLERILERVQVVAAGEWCKDDSTEDTNNWFAAADQSIKAIFAVSPEPEKACVEIIRMMHSSTFERDGMNCHPLRLARFFHVVGQVALSLLVYTENLVAVVRRANAKKTLKKQEDADKAKVDRGNSSISDNDEQEAIEEELGMAAEQEAENERQMQDISENQITSNGLLSVYVPLLVSVVGNDSGVVNSSILRQASCLALCKLMSVSRQFCEKHLDLLFTVLSQSPSTTLKANTVVALGDLAFRFPNEVEPYTQRIYALLRDDSIKVRRHTMMVLTHLILNDQVKVKGNVCEIALCLRDDDLRIRDMSRLLFHELSKRSNNPVYNLLPDIVSRLSQLPDRKEDFRSIMSFLLAFIKKERQNEMLAEKFLQRYASVTSISQKGDIAYCLSLLKMNERSIKHLSDNLKIYKDSLHDEDVNKSFTVIVAKAKKTLKQEMRPFLEEWESKLDDQAQKSKESEQAGARANVKKNNKSRKKKQMKIIEEDEEENYEPNHDSFVEQECS